MTAWLGSPRRAAAVFMGLLALTLLVLLLRPSELPNARSFQTQDTPWSLPVPVTIDADKALSGINQRRLWAFSPPGVAPAPVGPAVDEAPLTPPDWRIVGIVGIVGVAGQLTLLIARDAPKGLPSNTLALKLGESLPGGAKIVQIRPDGVGLLLHGQRAFLSTYPR